MKGQNECIKLIRNNPFFVSTDLDLNDLPDHGSAQTGQSEADGECVEIGEVLPKDVRPQSSNPTGQINCIFVIFILGGSSSWRLKTKII
jgi:hypothetical protein